MFEILPIEDKQEQKKLTQLCGMPYFEELLAYKAIVEGEFCGVCQFEVKKEGGRIATFGWLPERYAFEPIFIMGRAALNFIDLCGVHKAFFDAPGVDETLVKAIGFAKNADGRYEVDLTDFFKEPCKHRKTE